MYKWCAYNISHKKKGGTATAWFHFSSLYYVINHNPNNNSKKITLKQSISSRNNNYQKKKKSSKETIFTAIHHQNIYREHKQPTCMKITYYITSLKIQVPSVMQIETNIPRNKVLKPHVSNMYLTQKIKKKASFNRNEFSSFFQSPFLKVQKLLI